MITRIAAVLPALFILPGMVTLILWSSFRGFDFTDDSFYVLNIWHPMRNYGAVSEFGKYLSVLPLFFGRDIVTMRIVSLFCLLFVGLLASLILVKISGLRAVYQTCGEFVTTTCVVCISMLAYYKYWLLTPSYNTFILLGTFLVGLTLVNALKRRRQMLNWRSAVGIGLMMGIGGILTAIGRPTGALAAGAIAGAWLVTFLRLKNSLVIGAISIVTVATLLAVHACIFDGSLYAFIQRITFARDLAATLNAGHSLTSAFARSMDSLLEVSKRLLSGPYMWGLITSVLIFWVQFVVHSPDQTTPREKFGVATVAGSAVLLIGSMLTAHDHWESYLGFLGVDLSVLLITLLLFAGFPFTSDTVERAEPRTEYLIANLYSIPFVMLALTASFGSTTDIVAASGLTFVLYAVAVLIGWSALIPVELRTTKMAMHSLLCIAVGYGLLHSVRNPYRLDASLLRQTEATSLMDSDTILRVDAATANWINTLKRMAVEHKWVVGESLIDLTGGTPGAALVLGARPPTTPWLIGGYLGSVNYVTMALNRADTDHLRDAWILTAPNGVRHLDGGILRTFGLAFPEGYDMVGELRSGHRDEVQFLWKPKDQRFEE